MRAIFEVEDDKVSVQVEGCSLAEAIAALLSKLPYRPEQQLTQLRTLDQKSRLHIPYQILNAAKIPTDSQVVVTYDSTFDCVRVTRS